jgi:hypothetical protein
MTFIYLVKLHYLNLNNYLNFLISFNGALDGIYKIKKYATKVLAFSLLKPCHDIINELFVSLL